MLEIALKGLCRQFSLVNGDQFYRWRKMSLISGNGIKCSLEGGTFIAVEFVKFRDNSGSILRVLGNRRRVVTSSSQSRFSIII